MTLRVFFDEAGNTGDDLLNADQPAFVVSSHTIDEGEARQRLEFHFPRNRARELKYSSLKKQNAGQSGVLELLRALKSDKREIALYPVHKQFSLFQRLFDYLVEPVMKEGNFPAYDAAFNIQATNVGFIGLREILGRPFMDRMLVLFQRAVRERSTAHLKELWRHIHRGRARRGGPQRMFIDMLLLGEHAGTTHFDRIPPQALDPAFPTFVALFVHWRRQSEGPFEIVHDNSKPVAANRKIWDWFSSPEQQQRTLGFGDYRDVPLPLNVVGTTLAKSEDYFGLQLADLLAGASLEVCRYKLGDYSRQDFAEALIEIGMDDVVNSIWPDPNWKMPNSAGHNQPEDPLEFIAQGLTRGVVQ